jgi:cytochrome c oxidase subunit 2
VSESAAAIPQPGGGGPAHGRRIALIWAVATAIVVPLVIWVVGPHIPPGSMSQQAHDQHDVNVALTALATPVLLMVWVYFGYAIRYFRGEGDAVVDGPPITGNARVQAVWLVATSALVLGLAVFGTIDLLGTGGAGGGEGPAPLAKPADASNALQVQVIGQQWEWTFRYPSYGGVETDSLALPVGREVELHVTSLDVAHSFWAIELAVKADAIPGSDNVAFVKAERTGSFQVRCAELCGLWHGHMNTTARIVSDASFSSWIAAQQRRYTGITKTLPPFAYVYYPDPTRNAT